MKTKLVFVFILFAFIFPVKAAYARQAVDYLAHSYYIDIFVYDLNDALLSISDMPGFDVNSHIDLLSKWAFMERRVPVSDIYSFINMLNEIGEIRAFRVNSRSVFSGISDTTAALGVRTTEHERLIELLREVETMEHFNAVENRLFQVIRNIEQLRGRINEMEFVTSMALVNITMQAYYTPLLEEDPRGIRLVSRAFINSANLMIVILRGSLLGLIHTSVPLIICLVLIFGIYKIRRRLIVKGVPAALLLIILFSACAAPDFAGVPGPSAADAAVAYAPFAQQFSQREAAAYRVYGSALYEDDIYTYTDRFERMIIRNAFFSMDTTDFTGVTSEIENLTVQYGGFIESSNRWLVQRHGESYWVSQVTLRFPVANFDGITNRLMTLGRVTSFSASSEDITMEFMDIENRLEIRLEEESRILTMIENTTDLADLISLEERLGNVRITIDSYRRSLTEMDDLASFSTIDITIREVETIDDGILITFDGGIFGDMSEAFRQSVNFTIRLIETIAVIIASLILPGSIFGFIGYVIWKLIKKYKPVRLNIKRDSGIKKEPQAEPVEQE